MGEDADKLNINANPAGTLEVEEFKNRMAHWRKGRRLKVHLKRKK